MENVVYLLGAGFSAPLGLPVMSNFMRKSKDLFFEDPTRYKYFEKVFDTIRDMHICKSYFHSDLFNIEEILSIMEMTDSLGQDRLDDFDDYILDVISGFTPEIPKTEVFDLVRLFDEPLDNYYGYFVASLFNLMAFKQPDRIFGNRDHERTHSYSVITLNYDLVLENYFNFFRTNFNLDDTFEFNTRGFEGAEKNAIFLAKLHGSVDTRQIIPPTWNKGLNDNIRHTWQMAIQLLMQANHIRVIGYSLPITDAYIKYLFKSAIIKNDNLKTLDVLCLDQENQAKSRYKEFIVFPSYRFKSANVEDYLKLHYDLCDRAHSHSSDSIKMTSLETAHETFFQNNTP